MAEKYDRYHRSSFAAANELAGSTLHEVYVDVVENTFNVLYLLCDQIAVVLDGVCDGEFVRIAPMKADVSELKKRGLGIIAYTPYQSFCGHKIEEVREIGAPWKGHGWELGFKGMMAESMLVQSVYANPKPEGLEDCLKLGVGTYRWS